MAHQSINEQLIAIEEFSVFEDKVPLIIIAALIVGFTVFFFLDFVGHSLFKITLPIAFSSALGVVLLNLFFSIPQSGIATEDMQQGLNERMLLNTQENVAFEDISFLQTEDRGDVRVATFQAVNESGEYTEFQMSHSPEHDMMIPYGDLSSEDIPIVPESDLDAIIQ